MFCVLSAGTGLGWSTIYEITERDRIYNALPLYHSAGGTLSPHGEEMVNVCTFAERPRVSGVSKLADRAAGRAHYLTTLPLPWMPTIAARY